MRGITCTKGYASCLESEFPGNIIMHPSFQGSMHCSCFLIPNLIEYYRNMVMECVIKFIYDTKTNLNINIKKLKKMRRGTMIRSTKQLVLKVLFFCITVFLLNNQVYSRICSNGAGGGYEDPGGKLNLVGSKDNSIIENYIEEGGGYYLNTFSDIMSISNRIEMANLKGIDYEELKRIADSALANIRNAKATYYLLIKTAQETPYDPIVNLKLRSFNYYALMTEHSLNVSIFNEVAGYLKNGDITGTFIRIKNSFIKIEGLLISIKYEVALNKMPELSKIWEVNEEASNTLIFGQYITRIFYALY
ncbi:MAG: hypothetical protein ACFFG0_36135 [Candidatus Thorarchaeota archaeon]